MLFRITTVISLVGGTMFLMWLGEQITSRGIGNGVSLIIMAGIVAQLPTRSPRCSRGGRTGTLIAARDHGVIAHGRGPDPVHLLHGAGAAPRADPISQAPDGARPDAGRSARTCR
jgi:preprotein translocase subunit SecY